ncbi:TonB family protein [candidate division GN15 bacterium]|nr:TonB family protein [candidate division GN15 bacterium]
MIMQSRAVYSAYGAHALKASYQRNMLLGLVFATLVALSAAGAIVISGLLTPMEAPIAAVVEEDSGRFELPDEKVVIEREIGVGGRKPPIEHRGVVIPKPVADSLLLDGDEVTIATRQELAMAGNAYGVDTLSDVGSRGLGEFAGPVGAGELPDPGPDFTPCEIYPEMIYQHVPEYPRLAKQAGIEGMVWVQALVDEDGEVERAIVAKSSGVASLDESALRAAYENKFKPGIQNGRPVPVWVTYKVEFVLR